MDQKSCQGSEKFTDKNLERVLVELPWPDKLLSPNARPHWAAKAKAAKKAKKIGFYLARESKIRIDFDGPVHLWITFYPPDKRRRDDDNVIASFKNYRDGIAEGLGIDDHRFVCHPMLHTTTSPGGKVVVAISSEP